MQVSRRSRAFDRMMRFRALYSARVLEALSPDDGPDHSASKVPMYGIESYARTYYGFLAASQRNGQ